MPNDLEVLSNVSTETEYANINGIYLGPKNHREDEFFNSVSEILEEKGIDVESTFLEHFKSLKPNTANIEYGFYPYYHIIFDNHMTWKDENGETKEKIEQLGFDMFFDEDNQKSPYYKIISKKTNKSVFAVTKFDEKEMPVFKDRILKNEQILKKADLVLKQTKAFKKLDKATEKMTKIENVKMEVYLIPILKMSFDSKTQLMNQVDGQVFVEYTKNIKITKLLKKTYLMRTIPTVCLIGISVLLLCLGQIYIKNPRPQKINILNGHITNIYGLLFFYLAIINAIYIVSTSFIGGSRENIIKHLNKDKDIVGKVRNLMVLPWVSVVIEFTAFIILLFEHYL